MDLKDFWKSTKLAFKEWNEDKAARLAAALAYYTAFSIPPLLVIVIAVAGIFLGRDAVQTAILNQIGSLIGPQSAEAVKGMITNASQTGTGIRATIIGTVVLLLGASGVFGQLQDSLNTIWEVKPNPKQGLLGLIKKRFFSFSMVLVVGFLLLVSLVATAALGAVGDYFTQLFPGFEVLMQVLNFIVSFLVITLMFALLFKYVPDAKIAWGDVWLGAAITSMLFTVGRTALGLYLGNSSTASDFGAASAVIIILVWIYYSAQILFFGAEFTQVYANNFGSGIVPEEGAQQVSDEERIKQGIPRETTPSQRPQPAPQTTPGLVPVTAVESRARPARPDFRPSPLVLIQAATPMIIALLVGVAGSVAMVREERKQDSREKVSRPGSSKKKRKRPG